MRRRLSNPFKRKNPSHYNASDHGLPTAARITIEMSKADVSHAHMIISKDFTPTVFGRMEAVDVLRGCSRHKELRSVVVASHALNVSRVPLNASRGAWVESRVRR
ncbi:hypothetical protein PROFUN_12560 [Planoprotostelium fungivorum]|uniref:Uncharacterized protein n=1 Tax=Planoprotostelium fungivorum TaxID=1890364 RepID=A0A2P6N771_9EUKA|nr:hypothetical protein PROFUN_12560 [Planoprotostelium fungivorum]